MLRPTTRPQLLRGLTLTAICAGVALCLLTGRTAAHGLTIVLATLFLVGALHLADAYLPNRQSRRVRRLSAALFAAAWAALLAFYCWHFAAAQYVFINDDALYYYQQLELSAHLSAGLADTLRHAVASLSTDYPSIPNLILAPLFSLTDRSSAGFGLAAVLMAWTPILYQLRRITLALADRMGLTGGRTLLLCAGTCLCVFALPLLHRAAAWRQPNLLGLPLLLQVVFLSWRADFRLWEPLRLTAIFVSAVLLVMMRRWFLFFLAGYLPLWGLTAAVRCIRQGDWPALRRLLLWAGLCTAIGIALLWPMLRRAVAGNYAVAYAHWRKEDFSLPYELLNQSWLLGRGCCLMVLAGYAWGLLQRHSRELRHFSAVMLLGSFIAMALFTTIQNMTYHQATILLPAYVLGLMLFFGMLASLRGGWLRACAAALSCAALLLQWGLCVTKEKPQLISPLLSHVSLKPPVRSDLEQLQAVSSFISDTCDAEHPALILMNSSDYDRLTFVALRYPDLSMREKVALDRIALPSDGFPRAWFSARYILVPTQPQTAHPGGTVEKLTHYLLADASDRFELVTSFPLGGFGLLVLERRVPVRYDEVEELTALFAQEHALYPKVYGDRIGFFYGLALE